MLRLIQLRWSKKKDLIFQWKPDMSPNQTVFQWKTGQFEPRLNDYFSHPDGLHVISRKDQSYWNKKSVLNPLGVRHQGNCYRGYFIRVFVFDIHKKKTDSVLDFCSHVPSTLNKLMCVSKVFNSLLWQGGQLISAVFLNRYKPSFSSREEIYPWKQFM